MTLLVVTFAAAPVRAQEGDAEAQGKEKFLKGVELFKQENYAAALAEFKESQELNPKPIVLYNIAMCEKALFRYEDSIATFTKYLAEAKKLTPEKKKEVEDHIKEMESMGGKLLVAVSPADAAVVVDGKIAVKMPMEKPLLLSPGEHTVEARKDGFKAASQTVVVTQGGEKKVEIALEALALKSLFEVSCASTDATASVDGAPGKKTPASFELAPGPHTLVVEAPGMIKKQQDVTLVAGQKTVVAVSLDPVVVATPAQAGAGAAAKKKPFYKTAWFWSVVGVAVATGAGLGVYFGAFYETGGGRDVYIEMRPQ